MGELIRMQRAKQAFPHQSVLQAPNKSVCLPDRAAPSIFISTEDTRTQESKCRATLSGVAQGLNNSLEIERNSRR